MSILEKPVLALLVKVAHPLLLMSLLLTLVAFPFGSYSHGQERGDIVTKTLETELVPSPVTFSALLPPSYLTKDSSFLLLFWLHGGSGDHRALRSSASIFRSMWAAGTLQEMVVVTPTATQSQYMDYRDGSQQWETFIVKELLTHVRTNFRITSGKGAVSRWAVWGR